MDKLATIICWVVLLFVFGVRPSDSIDCLRTPTSEGVVALKDGQFACSELLPGQRPEESGTHFVQCVGGRYLTMPCSVGLRWDTSANRCNYPNLATCKKINDVGPTITETLAPPSTTRRAITILDNPTTTSPTRPSTANIKVTDRPTERRQTRRTRAASPPTTLPTTTTTTTTSSPTRRTSSRRPRTRTTTPPIPPTVPTEPTIRDTTRRTTQPLVRTTFPNAPMTPEATRRTTQPLARTTVPQTVTAGPNNNRTTQQLTTRATESSDCVGVQTSEGLRTLGNGQKACAPLTRDEDQSQLGKKYVICSGRTVFLMECQPGLLYDTRTGLCNWPEQSTCQFGDKGSTDKKGAPAGDQKDPSANDSCNADTCRLPDCLCVGDSPTAVSDQEKPQFIMLTFDDAVTSPLYNSYYRSLFVDNEFKLFNPNGCPIRATFYVSHVNTDYRLVKSLWEAGHEIGSHTINHELPQGDKDSDYDGMADEIQGWKEELLQATGNLTLFDSVVGFRAPYLRVAGDVQFDVLRDFKFRYDTSVLNINILQKRRPFWPHSLTYVMKECINPPCPSKPYPGLWEFQLNGWVGDDKAGCSMVDACVVGSNSWTASQEQWFQFYDRHFSQYFYPIKVPMPIFTHGFLFANYPNSYGAMADWLKELLQTHKDVWLATPAQVLDWIQNPLTNQEMIDRKWGC